MKILVTGGAGFIGSALTRYIINSTNDSVVNVDKLTYAGNLHSLKDIDNCDRYVFVHADICDAKALDAILSTHKPDAVMHLAAESHVDRSITGPAAFIETNIVGTYVLLEAARKYWQTLEGKRNRDSVSITFLLMKYMVISLIRMTGIIKIVHHCLLRIPHMLLAVHTLPLKHQAIIWFARGIVLIISQLL